MFPDTGYPSQQGQASALAGRMEPASDIEGGDWLVNAINSVHKGMVEESDPKQISLLGAIINQLTTFQANRVNAGQQGSGGNS